MIILLILIILNQMWSEGLLSEKEEGLQYFRICQTNFFRGVTFCRMFTSCNSGHRLLISTRTEMTQDPDAFSKSTGAEGRKREKLICPYLTLSFLCPHISLTTLSWSDGERVGSFFGCCPSSCCIYNSCNHQSISAWNPYISLLPILLYPLWL